jgi:hypothetical protein
MAAAIALNSTVRDLTSMAPPSAQLEATSLLI